MKYTFSIVYVVDGRMHILDGTVTSQSTASALGTLEGHLKRDYPTKTPVITHASFSGSDNETEVHARVKSL